jgi:hypothetical protein
LEHSSPEADTIPVRLVPSSLRGESDVRQMVSDYYSDSPLVHVLPSPEGDMVDYRSPLYHTPIPPHEGYLQASESTTGLRGYLWWLVYLGWFFLALYPFLHLAMSLSRIHT